MNLLLVHLAPPNRGHHVYGNGPRQKAHGGLTAARRFDEGRRLAQSVDEPKSAERGSL